MASRYGANKYHARPTVYRGRTYGSKAEAAYAARLDLEVKAGTVLYWLPQPIVPLDALEYRADFLVVELVQPPPHTLGQPREASHFVDVKGVETQRFRDIKKLWAAHGPAPLRVVKRGKLAETVEPQRKV